MLAGLSDGYSGAEIASLCREAALAALEESVEAEAVKLRHFHLAFTRVKRMITSEMLEFYASLGSRGGRSLAK